MTRLSLAALLLTTAPLAAEVPHVVTDVPINHALAALVMGDLGTPELLLEQGGDPHHAQLRPSQARSVATADLVIWTGESMSPWMHEVVETLAAGRVLELATVPGLVTQPFAEAIRFEAEEEEHDHDEAGHEEHDHDEHEGHSHAHAPGAIDPHLWMNTANAALWLGAIAADLAALDPDNAATYVANASVAAGGIALLGAELAQILQPAQGAGLVMYHDAYGYFASQFGLTILGTIADGEAADPGAARITALRAHLAEAGAACIFPEVNHPDAFARVVAEGSALRIGAALDPAGVMLTPGPELYAQAMRQTAQAIADCVSAR